MLCFESDSDSAYVAPALLLPPTLLLLLLLLLLCILHPNNYLAGRKGWGLTLNVLFQREVEGSLDMCIGHLESDTARKEAATDARDVTAQE